MHENKINMYFFTALFFKCGHMLLQPIAQIRVDVRITVSDLESRNFNSPHTLRL